MVSRGGVTPFDGDLDDYQRYLLDEAKRQREEAKNSSSTPSAPAVAAVPEPVAAKPSKVNPSATKHLRKDLEKIDRQIESLNKEKTELQELLMKTSSADEIAQAGKRLKVIEDDLSKLEEDWLKVSEEIEALS
jgi:ATP-binding cassette subfamily F protein 3